jgi:hypothetical protein
MCGHWPELQSPPASSRRWLTQFVSRHPAHQALSRIFWRVLDGLDYRVTQVRLSMVDAVYGPEPETETDRQRGCDQDPLESAWFD